MTLFRQLFDPATATLSYLVADPVTRAAALIDPAPARLDAAEATIHALGLNLVYMLMTHTLRDDDAVTTLRAETSARIARHESSDASGCDQRLRDGDVIYLGEEMIEVLHTPGATPCSVCYLCGDRLFTGDTLWIGSAGDLSNLHADAGAMYDSVHRRLFMLPDETLVYPGHDRIGQRVSCIAQEKLRNTDLQTERTRFLAAHDPRYAARA
jgi:glyoxylase-like metal-dependent hydrolase (beta-lactamase superfamily II)